jgi:Raf kinase inhibitor-like YbhB/YbcL family protein
MSFVGRLLRPVRAGETHLASNHASVRQATESLKLSSDTFAANGPIPVRCAGRGVGDNVSPHLSWEGAPDDTQELVLIMEDPSAPLPRPFVHVVVTGIGASMNSLAEGALSTPTEAHVTMGLNSLRQRAYFGPRPVPGHGPHNYVFQLFALRRQLPETNRATKGRVLRLIDGLVVAHGRLTGTYERTSGG